MLEDELLKLRFLCGSSSALAQIYRKYADRLLALATALLRDANDADDVLHDVFVKFARADGALRISGSLGCYLAACVANRARDVLRQRRAAKSLEDMPAAEGAIMPEPSDADDPNRAADPTRAPDCWRVCAPRSAGERRWRGARADCPSSPAVARWAVA